MVFHQLDYLFAIGTMFAFLDAYNIGANDVANSWATSVASRSLTYIQAMCVASVMEFGGSMGVGARVADTIRTKVVDVKQFENNPPLLMLGMVCAVTGSSVFLTIATRFGMPVSTTHSILGGVIGMGIATVGRDGIHWWGGNINSGVVQVFLAWIFAPLLSGAFASIIFLLTKYGILLRKNAVMKALITVPIYFGITAALLTMLIVWKGGSSRISLNDAESAGVIVGVGAGVALLVGIFFVPWLYRVVIKGDAKLRWYQIPLGPMLLKRPEPTVPDSGVVVRDFYSGHKTREEVLADRGLASNDVDDVEGNANVSSTVAPTIESPTGVDLSDNEKTASNSDRKPGATDARIRGPHEDHIHHSIIGQRPEGAALSVAVLFWQFKRIIFHGVDQNVLVEQNKANFLTGDLNEIHSHAAHFDNNTEYMFTFLQAMVAATASFAHGANDVANAIGPYATIYYIWSSEKLNSSSPVPYWILAFGGAAIVIGLWTYGYNIMRNLGNRITLHSPSRGFSMELGSAITVILATRLALPVSTTQCISGATVGVGLCSGTWRTINWRMVAWIYMSWVVTLPCTGIISGCLMGIIINAPRWGLTIKSG